MAYIYLDDLKKILPGILDSWIDEDDESWEWIFSEIEQKCHVGKPCKGKKKKWKKKLREDVDELQYFRYNEYEVKLNGLKSDLKKLHECLNDSIQNTTQLGLSMKDMGAEIRHIREDVKAAKSMAETAKNRTEVKYNEIGIEKKPPHISYTLWSSAKHMLSVFEQRGATKEELEQLDFLFSKYIPDVNMTDSQWRKEHKQELNNLYGAKDCMYCEYSDGDGNCCKPTDCSKQKENKDCTTCKHYCGDGVIKEPCIGCTDYDCWEAKDGSNRQTT